MKAQMTRNEAIKLFEEVELKWSKGQDYFSKKIKKLLSLPESAIIFLEDGEISSLNETPFPLFGDIIIDKNIKGEVACDDYCTRIILWEDSKWYKPHKEFLRDVKCVLDKSREFWRIKNED